MGPEEIRENIEFYQKLLGIISKEPSSFVEDVFLKYLELRTTSLVAKYVNEKGHRIPSARRGMRKYISTDITELLDDFKNEKLVDSEVYSIVKKMQVYRRFGKEFMLNAVRK